MFTSLRVQAFESKLGLLSVSSAVAELDWSTGRLELFDGIQPCYALDARTAADRCTRLSSRNLGVSGAIWVCTWALTQLEMHSLADVRTALCSALL